VLQLNRVLGKPRRGDVNPFIVFMKSNAVERGDAPFGVKLYCRLLSVLSHVDNSVHVWICLCLSTLFTFLNHNSESLCFNWYSSVNKRYLDITS